MFILRHMRWQGFYSETYLLSVCKEKSWSLNGDVHFSTREVCYTVRLPALSTLPFHSENDMNENEHLPLWGSSCPSILGIAAHSADHRRKIWESLDPDG